MALARVFSSALQGLVGHRIEIDVDVSPGLPAFDVVGLPDAAVREARERVRAAIRNSGFDFPFRRVTVNLAPADLRKAGSAYDLPIAVGILLATGQIGGDGLAARLRRCLMVGELALDGSLRPVPGVLPMAIAAAARADAAFLVPRGNAAEAAAVENVEVWAADTLSGAIDGLTGKRDLHPACTEPAGAEPAGADPGWEGDLGEVFGQQVARRALEIAAAGGHNLLLIGPPGSGKTMLARRLPSILPRLDPGEALQVSQIHSAAGLLPAGSGLLRRRPFRAPHHTISAAAMVGGGNPPRPGEVSLAHRGVLFLDELPEFHRDVREALRQPLEDGSVSFTRAGRPCVFPARPLTVAALNPCHCGYLGDPRRPCTCSPAALQRYRGRVSGPLLDRLEIQVEVPRVPFSDLRAATPPEPSVAVAERVRAARERQAARFGPDGPRCNAEMGARDVQRHCRLDAAAARALERSFEQLGLSARAHARVLKVARTIADLEGSAAVHSRHVLEAVQYRAWDRAGAYAASLASR